MLPLLIGESDSAFRHLLIVTLRRQYSIVGITNDGNTLLQHLYQATAPLIVLLDLALRSDRQATAEIIARDPVLAHRHSYIMMVEATKPVPPLALNCVAVLRSPFHDAELREALSLAATCLAM